MTANTSPTINKGNNIPVEALLPKTSASNATEIVAIPFIPDFEIPIIKLAPKASIQLIVEISGMFNSETVFRWYNYLTLLKSRS